MTPGFMLAVFSCCLFMLLFYYFFFCLFDVNLSMKNKTNRWDCTSSGINFTIYQGSYECEDVSSSTGGGGGHNGGGGHGGQGGGNGVRKREITRDSCIELWPSFLTNSDAIYAQLIEDHECYNEENGHNPPPPTIRPSSEPTYRPENTGNTDNTDNTDNTYNTADTVNTENTANTANTMNTIASIIDTTQIYATYAVTTILIPGEATQSVTGTREEQNGGGRGGSEDSGNKLKLFGLSASITIIILICVIIVLGSCLICVLFYVCKKKKLEKEIAQADGNIGSRNSSSGGGGIDNSVGVTTSGSAVGGGISRNVQKRKYLTVSDDVDGDDVTDDGIVGKTNKSGAFSDKITFGRKMMGGNKYSKANSDDSGTTVGSKVCDIILYVHETCEIWWMINLVFLFCLFLKLLIFQRILI